jgi:hypothetical protein
MATGKRKIMFLMFILSFFIVASLVIIYAQGYRIKLSWPLDLNESLQKTGMLVLKTNPGEAQIYIDNTFGAYLSNKLTAQEEDDYTRTPAKIKYLMPGEYKITVKKDGYWTWEKEVTIEPGKQTRLEDIRLFKKTLPRRIVEAPLQNIHTSPDKQWAVLEKDNKLLDLNKNTTRDLSIQNIEKNAKSETAWSPNSLFFTVGSHIYNTENTDLSISLKKEAGGEKIKNIKWKNNSVLQYQAGESTLKEFDVNSKNSKDLLKTEEEIVAYKNASNYIHIVAKNENKAKYKLFSENGRLIREVEIPYSVEYKFINEDHSLINLLDQKNKTLYLIRPQALFDPIMAEINGIKYVEWKDEHNLLYANDFEIWNYSLTDGNKSLITRISRPITGIDKPFEEGYVIFYTKQDINIIEERGNGANNTTELIKLNDIMSPGFDKNNNVIYFNAEIGKETGVYKLQI